MNHIYTFGRRSSLPLLIILLLLASTNSFGQTPSLCGGIAENFNNTSGSTAGFTGDFKLSTNTGNNFLQKDRAIATAVYTVTTPTYQLPANASFVGFGFILGGTQIVARAEIKIMYVSTLNDELTTVFLGQFVPAYAPGSNTTEICRAVSLADLPGFPPNGSYRFQIELTPNTGSGAVGDLITFDDFKTTGTLAQSPLPVNFIGIDAKKLNNEIQLTWKVAGEENVANYEVQRSSDGRSFRTVAVVTTHGKDTYFYTDAAPTGPVFYRIKNVDNDGKFKYSTIARIANGRTAIVLRGFPQPVQNTFTLQHPSIDGRAVITLQSASGRTVRNVVPAGGSMQTAIDMANLPRGMYLLRFDDGNGLVETLKVLKQ